MAEEEAQTIEALQVQGAPPPHPMATTSRVAKEKAKEKGQCKANFDL